jgi:hypothetical protein
MFIIVSNACTTSSIPLFLESVHIANQPVFGLHIKAMDKDIGLNHIFVECTSNLTKVVSPKIVSMFFFNVNKA